jgi:hypothetical protein
LTRAFILSPCPLPATFLTRFDQSSILQDHRVDNLSTVQTFPPPKLLMKTIEFVIDHEATAPKALFEKQLIHWSSSGAANPMTLEST